MLRITGPSIPLCDGISRREWLRVGGVGLGALSLPGLLRARATGAAGRAKSAIVLYNTGGIPHHETWDPKPDAPAEIRGAFGTIATRTPGLRVGELMPLTAGITDKVAVIRSMVTLDNAHSSSGYQMLTGVPHVPLNRENAKPGKPNDWPSFAALVQALRPGRGGLPAAISMPQRIANNNGQDPWPGTDAGFLGRRHDPWFRDCDPSDPHFSLPGGDSKGGFHPEMIGQRRSLLEGVNRRAESLLSAAASSSFDLHAQRALDLVSGRQARVAFDMERESDKVRDRYGRTKYGQCVLLARRLVEAGVSLVQVQWANHDKAKPNGGGWDTHEKHNESIKGWLIPPTDLAFSALVTDLSDRGMLDETLVCWIAEFGHTPRFNPKGGRDHWGRVFSVALAGGGIRGGTVLGASDKHAAEVLRDPVRPCDFLATVFHCLGHPPDTEVRDVENRPLAISRGRVLTEILA
jgi:uncharacterized protein (DUF1501 family)